MTQLTAAFDLREIEPCNSSPIEHADSLRVTTPPAQWAYAARIPFHWENGDVLPEGFCLSVKVDATVEAGAIGFGLTSPDLQSFVSRERWVAASERNITLDLKLDLPCPGLWLVVRNVCDAGMASIVQLHRVSVDLEQRTPECALAAVELSVFDAPDALSINQARMQNLESLGLSLEGRSVLDVGSGPGHLAVFFAERGCRVVCVDARPENIERLRSLYPDREAAVANVQSDSLAGFGTFDIVFCYGLLYHVEDPIAVLRNISAACSELLLLETIVTDDDLPVMELAEEPTEVVNQAAAGFGCRPSPAFVTLALAAMGFPFIYTPVGKPAFPDFQFDRRNDSQWRRDGHLLRQIFVASRRRLDNPALTPLREPG